MKTIKCTIWKIGNLYRITVNDIRYRNLDTACIFDIDILFESNKGDYYKRTGCNSCI